MFTQNEPVVVYAKAIPGDGDAVAIDVFRARNGRARNDPLVEQWDAI